MSGDIHESARIIIPSEEIIQQGEWQPVIEFNPGAVYDHLERKDIKPSAGIMGFKNDKVRAYTVD